MAVLDKIKGVGRTDQLELGLANNQQVRASDYNKAVDVILDHEDRIVDLEDGLVVPSLDLNGAADALILDADGDTTLSSPTDDQIDVEINGADDFTFTANTFTALSGSTVATNTIAETTAASGVTVDGVLVKDSSVALADGLVSNLAVKIGADTNNGIYGVSDTQLGFAVEGVLVGGANTTGLFTDVVSEQTGTLGVTVDGLLIKDAGASASGTTATAGFLYSGTLSVSGAGTPQTLNTLVGTVTMTGVSDMAADATTSVVIDNSLVTASTIGLVTLQTTTAAAGSTPRIESVTYGAGTITIALRNSDALTATGAATYTFSFILFKL